MDGSGKLIWGWPIASFFTPLTPTKFYTLNITDSANVMVMEKTG